MPSDITMAVATMVAALFAWVWLRRGSVREGNSVGDHSAEARARQMSTEINVANATFLDDPWTILDCPGNVELLYEAQQAMLVAEFGTVDFAAILEVLRADNWLHARGGGRSSPLWNEIKRAMRAARPGCFEYELEAELLYEFRRLGAQFPAYWPIVAGGANACVLHYVQNDAVLNAGDLLLIDAGCEVDGYASDVTRTFPVSGKFELTIGSAKPVDAMPGQAYFMERGTPHGFRNIGSSAGIVMEVFVKDGSLAANRDALGLALALLGIDDSPK
jgi:hypothetical protein